MRIIPARAGFTQGPLRPGPRGRDHPRSRGVYDEGGWPKPGLWGSSPLARGLPRGSPPGGGSPRIIPARAGFTHVPRALGGRLEDHPRSRGVYPSLRTSLDLRLGSSPLARGLLQRHPRDRAPRGIIPARAGFTRGRRQDSYGRQDHPRSRGVYPAATIVLRGDRGSSPLARGLRGDERALARAVGIIPARAGFTGAGSWRCRTIRDHPRSRGVYEDPNVFRFGFDGSSPLARGLPSWRWRR